MLELATAGWWRRAAAHRAALSAADLQPQGVVAYRATMVFLFILVIAPQSYFIQLQPLRIAFVTAAVAIIAYLFQRIVHRQQLVEIGPETRVLGLLVAWAVVTVPFSIWPGGSVQFLAGMYLKSVALFLLLAHVVDTRARMVTAAWALTLMAVPLALSGVRNFLSGAFVSDRIAGYEGGLTANPNDLALMLNLILPLTLALFLGAQRRATRLFLAAVAALLAVGVVVTFSRSGFLTLALVCVFYGWIMLRRRQHTLVLIGVVVVLAALPFLPASYIDRIATITSIEADTSGSSQERWRDSIAALEYIGSNPVVGGGIGQSALAMNEVRGARWLRVHNVYLETAVDLGIPGLLLMGLLIWHAAGAARRARLAESGAGGDRRFYFVCEGLWVSLVAFAFAALFYPAAYQFYFFLFGGLALAARSIATRTA